jgi:hypothetical protein
MDKHTSSKWCSILVQTVFAQALAVALHTCRAYTFAGTREESCIPDQLFVDTGTSGDDAVHDHFISIAPWTDASPSSRRWGSVSKGSEVRSNETDSHF